MTDRTSDTADGVPAGSRWLWVGALVGLALLFAIRLTWALAYELAEGRAVLGPRVFDEVTGVAIGLLPVGLFVVLVVRLRLGARDWRLTALVLGGTFVPVSVAHTWLLVRARAWLGPAFGFTQYGVDVPASRYVYEGATDLVHMIAFVAVFAAAEAIRAQRARDRRAATLERSLLEADLRALRLRLEPHFLFNALNTISATMYADVATADAQLAHLASLLRGALRTSGTQEVPLDEELELLGHYLALVRARFEDRLEVALDVDPAARRCLVPSLLLQPLVENAVRHGALERSGRGRIAVRVTRDDEGLAVRVFDDGPGLAPGRDPLDTGTGLSATVQRLRLLHGPAQRVTIGNVEGGFAVEVRLPAREVPEATGADAVTSLTDAGATTGATSGARAASSSAVASTGPEAASPATTPEAR
ncbi:MAG: histidine kinase [Gemmatimonadetes bacterium]|nr:histidine kinase [Gemmatimonadota bacterium]